MHQVNVKCLAKFEDPLIAVKFAKHDARKAGISDEFEAAKARRRGDVDVARFNAYSRARRLHGCIRFGVDGAHAMSVLHQMTDVVAMRQAANAAVIARRQNDSVANDDRADVFAVARGARGYHAGNRHEVVIPRSAFGACHECAYTSNRPPDSSSDTALGSRALQIPDWGHLTGWRCRGYLPSVKTRFGAKIIPFGLALALLASASATLAQSAPNGDELLAQIAVLEKPANQAALLKQPLDSARAALNRARNARTAGDVEHGLALEALALDYITIARDVLRATDLEAALNTAQTDLIKTETARRQTETLLEATIAQRERTKALLLQSHAERDAKKPSEGVKPANSKAKVEGTKPANGKANGEGRPTDTKAKGRGTKPPDTNAGAEGAKPTTSKTNSEVAKPTVGKGNESVKPEPSKTNKGDKP